MGFFLGMSCVTAFDASLTGRAPRFSIDFAVDSRWHAADRSGSSSGKIIFFASRLERGGICDLGCRLLLSCGESMRIRRASGPGPFEVLHGCHHFSRLRGLVFLAFYCPIGDLVQR